MNASVLAASSFVLIFAFFLCKSTFSSLSTESTSSSSSTRAGRRRQQRTASRNARNSIPVHHTTENGDGIGKGSFFLRYFMGLFSLFNRKRQEMVVRVVKSAQNNFPVTAAVLDAEKVRAAARKLVLSPIYTALHQPQRILSHLSSRKTLVLDLDETLVHSQLKYSQCCDVRLHIIDDTMNMNPGTIFYVSKRPYLDEFLRTSAQWYDIAIYTASRRKYANPLISTLDTHRVVQRRYFRDDCTFVNGSFVKDLSLVSPSLADVLIIDNSPAAYQFNPANALPIEAWYDDPNDEELLDILPLLYSLSFLDDVRSVLQLRLTRGALVPPTRSKLM